jgi:hypothetical protein
MCKKNLFYLSYFIIPWPGRVHILRVEFKYSCKINENFESWEQEREKPGANEKTQTFDFQ